MISLGNIKSLLGLLLGYNKFYCFVGESDSTNRKSNYTKKAWPKRESLTPVHKNVKKDPLVKLEDIFLSPLHINLGLIKFFTKVKFLKLSYVTQKLKRE